MSSTRTRRTLHLLHRYLGLVLVGFLGLAAITGSLLAYRVAIDQALNPDLFHVTSTGETLPALNLVERVEADNPRLMVTHIRLLVEPDRTLRMAVAARPGPANTAPGALPFNEIFVDPHNGDIHATRLRQPGIGRRYFVPTILELHRNLLAGDTGKWITGLMALAAFFEIVVGIYLIWPRARPLWQRLRQLLIPKLRKGSPANWTLMHRSLGLWAALLLLVMTFTGSAMNLEQPLFAPSLSLLSPVSPDPLAGRGSNAGHPTRLDFAEATASAANHAKPEGLQPSAVQFLPEAGAYRVYLSPTQYYSKTGLGPSKMYIDAHSGEVFGSEFSGRGSAADLVLQTLYPVHSGEIGGLATRVLVSLVGLAVLLLTITAVSMWLRSSAVRGGKRTSVKTAVNTSRSPL